MYLVSEIKSGTLSKGFHSGGLWLNKTCTLLLSTTIAMVSSVAYGQDAAGGVETLAPLVVSAQRYDSELKDVPVSVDVVTGEEIRRKGISRLSEALRLVPNVFVYDDGGSYNSAISMRGIGNEIPFTDPAVSVFVNGVPYSGNMSDFDLQNVERIEVLRGAQSTLYGQNTLAGAVNIITTAPGKKEWSGHAEVKVGSHGFREASASANGALIEDKLGLSLEAAKSGSDGYFKNTTTGNDKVGGIDNQRLRSVLDLTVSDDFDAAFTFDYSKEESAKIDSVERHKYEFARNEDPTEERTSKQGALSLNWYITDELEASSLTGVRTVDLDLFDNMGIVVGNQTRNTVDNEERTIFQEFRLVRPREDSDLGWQAGLYLAESKMDINQVYQIPTLFNTVQTFDHKQKSRWAEAYGQADYGFVQDWTVTVGGRLSRVERDVDHDYSNANTFGTTTFTTSDQQKSYHNAVGKLAISYAVTEDATIYGSFNQGFKPGTARSGATNLDQLFLPSEKSNTFELGVKGNVEKLTYSVAAFYTDYKNRHTFYNDGVSVPSTVAVPGAVSKGAELNLDYALQPKWNIFGKFAYLDTSFDSYILPGTTTNIGGNQFRDAPKWSLAIGSGYAAEIANGWELFVNADITFQTESQGNVAAHEISTNPSYAIVNTAVGIERDNLEVSLQAKNLFDRYYYATTAMNDGTGAPGAPRSVFLNAAYKF